MPGPHLVPIPVNPVVGLHGYFARRGILLRLFAESRCLRFGLPADEAGWQRLEQALQERPAWPL